MSSITSKIKSFPLIIAVVLIGLAGIGFYSAWSGVQNLENVMVAPKDLASYTFINKSDLEVLGVPSSSITEEDLTEEEYDERYASEGEDIGTFLTDSILARQRVQELQVAADPESSFAVVLPDERVVAATTTLEGAAIGTVRAGDVVDITLGGGSSFSSGAGGSAEYAKVICIGVSLGSCENVLPPGVRLSSVDGEEEAAAPESSGAIILLLAVDTLSAPTIAGQSVSLSLNPFCRVDRSGYFVSTRPDNSAACEPPAGRQASSAPQAPSGGTGGSGAVAPSDDPLVDPEPSTDGVSIDVPESSDGSSISGAPTGDITTPEPPLGE